jgi:glucose-1-phosphate cytidylyltransferase
MVPLSGKPILWHLMNIFAKQNHHEFVLALGYRKEFVQDWLHNFENTDNWLIDPLDTGLDTQTGGRIKKCLQKYPNQRVIVTYGDGLANISLHKLLDFHQSHKKIATVTAVRPPARFGHLSMHGDKVVSFGEKVQADEGWINGGFFVLEPEVIEMIDNDWDLFETGALPKLAMANQLMAFKHEYFWKPMDTLREKNLLEELWASGSAPWKAW